MNTPQELLAKKAFLYSLIISVLLSAVLGIVAILSGDWSWFNIRILLTTVTVTGASICGLACGAYVSTKRGRALPLAGIGLALAGAAMVIGGIWIEVGSEWYWKMAASLTVFAVACAHLSLLAMTRLAGRFQWSLVAAHVVIFGVASLIVFLILGESHSSGMFRLLAVAAIVDAAITVLIPIFHWLSKRETAREPWRATEEESMEPEITSLKERLAELEMRRGRR